MKTKKVANNMCEYEEIPDGSMTHEINHSIANDKLMSFKYERAFRFKEKINCASMI